MGLPWIQVDKSFPKSPAAIRLGKALNLGRLGAVGLCNEFWIWAADSAPDGIVDGADPTRVAEVIDEAVGVAGFTAAMIEVGLLEPVAEGLRLVGWDRYLKALEKAARDAKNARARRANIARQTRGESATDALESQTESQTVLPPIVPLKGDGSKTEPAGRPRARRLPKALRDQGIVNDPGPRPEACKWYDQDAPDARCFEPPTPETTCGVWLCPTHADMAVERWEKQWEAKARASG